MAGESSSSLGPEDRKIVDHAEAYLDSGTEVYEWWSRTEADDGFADKFDLMHIEHQPRSWSYGFIDRIADVGGSPLPVVGMDMNMIFDRQKSRPGKERVDAEWLSGQVREYALKYFMRASLAYKPREVPEKKLPPLPGIAPLLDWSGAPVAREGARYMQRYYKRKDGTVGKFSRAEQTATVDLREIGQKYEWIIYKIHLFDFVLSVPPFTTGVQLGIPFKAIAHVVVSSEFIYDEEKPEPGVLGRYGFGFAFIKSDVPEGILEYGPEGLGPAYMDYRFEVLDDGEVRFGSMLAANQPQRLVNISLNPVDWAVLFADTVTLGATAGLLDPVQKATHALPLGNVYFKPIETFMTAANLLTLGWAKRELSIDKPAFLREVMAIHYMDMYEYARDVFAVWAQVADWTSDDVPEWITDPAPAPAGSSG